MKGICIRAINSIVLYGFWGILGSSTVLAAEISDTNDAFQSFVELSNEYLQNESSHGEAPKKLEEIEGLCRKIGPSNANNSILSLNRQKTREISVTPLIQAVRLNLEECVKGLIAKGADVNGESGLHSADTTPLYVASSPDISDAILDVLLKTPGIELDKPNKVTHETALLYAVVSSNIRKVVYLLRAGANPNLVIKGRNTTPFYSAFLKIIDLENVDNNADHWAAKLESDEMQIVLLMLLNNATIERESFPDYEMGLQLTKQFNSLILKFGGALSYSDYIKLEAGEPHAKKIDLHFIHYSAGAFMNILQPKHLWNALVNLSQVINVRYLLREMYLNLRKNEQEMSQAEAQRYWFIACFFTNHAPSHLSPEPNDFLVRALTENGQSVSLTHGQNKSPFKKRELEIDD